MINLKTILSPKIKAGYEAFKEMKPRNKWIAGIAAFFGITDLASFIYSKTYNTFHSMHSGKETSMSSYSNQNMTDFGSRWKGLSENILKLTKFKNKGISETLKVAMTPFDNTGIDLNRTMLEITKRQPRHQVVSLKNRIDNTVLNLHKRNIGHIADL